ncbi:MAG: TlyA family RNA methyltransferase, partial [Elusimicrobia bacterium]|nr:TlyA family RNA methyltransferase [Elusimicrobiota bacterium]
MAKKLRLDQLLVEKGLFSTRAKAQAAIMAGEVLVDGKKQTKAGAATAPEAALELAARSPYVSRGGLKLAAALAVFPVKVAGRVCLDLGASTGGFTDCLLQRGAALVYAVDVGTSQLDAKLKADPRVVSREQTHARLLRPEQFDPRPELCVIDVSFISRAKVRPHAAACLRRPCELLALVKPQFEVGPKLAPKGVVRDPAARAAAVEGVRSALP